MAGQGGRWVPGGACLPDGQCQVSKIQFVSIRYQKLDKQIPMYGLKISKFSTLDTKYLNRYQQTKMNCCLVLLLALVHGLICYRKYLGSGARHSLGSILYRKQSQSELQNLLKLDGEADQYVVIC